MNAYAINGQTAATKGFSGIMYRVLAFMAGHDSGTFLTESAAAIGGFRFDGFADFDSRWTGAGSNVVHPNFNVSRLVPVVSIKRETARVIRWAKLNGEEVTNEHRTHVAALAKSRHAESKAFARKHGDHGAALLAMLSDYDAATLAHCALASPDGSPDKRAWSDAMRHAKALHFLTI